MNETQLIGQMFKTIVERVNANIDLPEPYTSIRYDQGRPKELSARLSVLQAGTEDQRALAAQPMVFFVEETPIERGGTKYWGIGNFSIDILVITEHGYMSIQRDMINYDPVLNLIYDEFIRQVSQFEGFVTDGDINHRVTDWKNYKGDQTGFNSYVDIKSIRNLRLTIDDINCLTPININ